MSDQDQFPPFDDPGGGPSDASARNIIHGSYAGRTVPTWLDPSDEHGKLTVLKLEGENGPLPSKPFLLRTSVEKWIGGKIEGAFRENRGISYALKVRNPKQVEKLMAMKT